MSDILDRSASSLSLHSAGSQPEDDWDRSLIESDVSATVEDASTTTTATVAQLTSTTPRNSVIFPAEDTPSRATRYSSKTGSGYHSKNGSVDSMTGKGSKRTLSELLRLHSERGSNGRFSAEEASRIADVLGQWINASSSPYEGEDDFFRSQTQDDIKLTSTRKPGQPELTALGVRPRGRSESANSNASHSRPPSSLGAAIA